MNNKMIVKDERTTFIENISYSYGYKFISYALLLDVIYRSLRFNEAPWDLLGIIVASGFVMGIYQFKKKILGKAWLRAIAIIIIVAFFVAFLTALIIKKF